MFDERSAVPLQRSTSAERSPRPSALTQSCSGDQLPEAVETILTSLTEEHDESRAVILRLLRPMRFCASLERQRSGPSRANKKPLVKGAIEL